LLFGLNELLAYHPKKRVTSVQETRVAVRGPWRAEKNLFSGKAEGQKEEKRMEVEMKQGKSEILLFMSAGK